MKLFFKIKSDPIFDIVAAQRQFNNVYAHMNMNTCQIVLLTLFMIVKIDTLGIQEAHLYGPACCMDGSGIDLEN
ncbi:uncharacterized protein Dmoj_GI25954, isoform C [Drosophila mojavensis]|uniref:Uncharacterized protein, isoform C n=1 Tax=Drosophila mojavensis TaxID=7230 RepID=A0A0Q9X504_DROMO|nr:uncharacterized protein Dmoj_GI25954, isoform C [Drosophila mojavensis]